MVCVYCGKATRVSNSRAQKKSNQIWRRRVCLDCGATFTTHETVFLPSTLMIDKNGRLEPFEPARLLNDLTLALKHRQDRYTAARELSLVVTNKLRTKLKKNQAISPVIIALTTADTLKHFDKRAWSRFTADFAYLQD